MSVDVLAVRAALDAGASLEELERTLLGFGSGDDDHRAAGWLYAWAYEAMRPRSEDLVERLTERMRLGPSKRVAQQTVGPSVRGRPSAHQGRGAARTRAVTIAGCDEF